MVSSPSPCPFLHSSLNRAEVVHRAFALPCSWAGFHLMWERIGAIGLEDLILLRGACFSSEQTHAHFFFLTDVLPKKQIREMELVP